MALWTSFANGTGANRLSVKVSAHGNLISFQSPANQEALFGGREGYVVCSGGDAGKVHGHDTGTVEGGFGRPTFVQPTAGAFPLTVTRNTTNGKFQLKQVWAKPDAAEKDVTLTMTLKNISGATINGVGLIRTGDYDVGSTEIDQGAKTGDSVWQWDDVNTTQDPPVGVMMTALTFGTPDVPGVASQDEWVNGGRLSCFGPSGATPTQEGDFAMQMIYTLGSISAGASKTVKIGFERM